MEVKASEAQGRRREAGSGGSAEQPHGPMDKNRIGGVSAGRAGDTSQSPYPSRARSVNPAVACGQWSNLSREVCVVSRSGTEPVVRRVTAAQKSAAGIVGPGTEGPNGKRGQ